ncbi:hypothetical protein FTO74_04675 [Granulicella sp. WH15]|uniref:hypothetical protein n=1 Tax=Granulicella sp. WH15 TaxID=2602070 RepID=UPI0013678DDC|nr:hypothetical protein [Granulicella sp. WH15]QHN02740.1 hypothetical protein FTO74_04675 [Granulicella sp. WH15]
MYRPVSRHTVLDVLARLRSLFREMSPATEVERVAQAEREAFYHHLAANMHGPSFHPMPHVIAEASRHFWLTLDGAHQLFGYNLPLMLDYDLQLNQKRTRIIESYPFQRDMLIDLPSRFGEDEVFERNALMAEVIPDWQTDLPIRTIDGKRWQTPGMFYLQIGTEDSLGARIPPGAIASVEPISEEEQLHPDPDKTYLLQFGNGYRCCSCSVSKGKLSLILASGCYVGPHEFRYPGEVRIAGRIRMFAMELPLVRAASLQTLPASRHGAPLILPWQQSSLPELFATKYLRFQRPREDWETIRKVLEDALHINISDRTRRRYRRSTESVPHTGTLIALSLSYVARYTDSLRTLHLIRPERTLYSLDTLLRANRLIDLPEASVRARTPEPEERWDSLRHTWGEWPTLLSIKFPRLQSMRNQVLRLHQSDRFNGLDPLIPAGAALLLEPIEGIPDTREDRSKTDWSRPVYALRTGNEIFCGYLEVNDKHYVLIPHPRKMSQRMTLSQNQVNEVSRVVGIATPA